jgi:D-sedoheptulose 7-phosphate isomerase
MICGNGGSAAQADHFAAELIGSGYPAISLTSPAVITAIANDFGYDEVFSRQIDAYDPHGRASDALIMLTTSGFSRNILKATRQAKNMVRIALTGEHSSGFIGCDVIIPFEGNTQEVQEQHLMALHKLWEGIRENRR